MARNDSNRRRSSERETEWSLAFAPLAAVFTGRGGFMTDHARISDGFHAEMSEDEYRAFPAWNQSAMKHSTLSKMRMARGETSASTPDMVRGSLVHCLLFDPLHAGVRFERRLDWRSSDGKEQKQRVESGEVEVLPDDKYEEAERMAEAIMNHRGFDRLMRREPQTELPIIWTDDQPTSVTLERDGREELVEYPASGVRCKALLDAYIDGIIVDVKTTRNAEPDAFARDANRYGYHIQAAHYCRGVELLTGSRPEFAIVAVESTPPHDVIIYQYQDEAIAEGMAYCGRVLNLIARAEEANRWPGYTTDVVGLTLPGYARAAMASGAVAMATV